MNWLCACVCVKIETGSELLTWIVIQIKSRHDQLVQLKLRHVCDNCVITKAFACINT